MIEELLLDSPVKKAPPTIDEVADEEMDDFEDDEDDEEEEEEDEKDE